MRRALLVPLLIAASSIAGCGRDGARGDLAKRGLDGPGGNSSRRDAAPIVVPPPPGHEAPGPGEQAPVALEPLSFAPTPDPSAAFERAAQAYAPRPAAAPPAELELRPPSCPHRYAFRARFDMQMLEPEDSAAQLGALGLWLTGSWTARAAQAGLESGAELELSVDELGLGHHKDDIRHPLGRELGTLASVRLVRDGRAWREVDGTTASWSAYGSWQGLVSFSPALPEQLTPATPSPHVLVLHDDGSGMRTEVTRGKLELPEGTTLDDLPEPTPYELEGEVELVRWVELGGVRAALVSTRVSSGGPLSETVEVPELPGELAGEAVEFAGDVREQAQLVVLESGQLLHASVVRIQHMSIGVGKNSMSQRHTIVSEARLVEACAGPVLPDFDDAYTPIERNLIAMTELRNAAIAEPLDPAAVTALLDGAVASAAPDAPACLAAVAEAHGALALGMPELPALSSTELDEGRATVVLSTTFGDEGRVGELTFVTRTEAGEPATTVIERFELHRMYRGEGLLLRFDADGLETSLDCRSE